MFKKFMFRSIIILLLPRSQCRPAMITWQINIRMNISRLTLIVFGGWWLVEGGATFGTSTTTKPLLKLKLFTIFASFNNIFIVIQ